MSCSDGTLSFASDTCPLDAKVSLPETNMFEPENQWLEAEFRFGKAYFQGLC